ncbi:MAG: hypothetical protein AA931_01240 [Peptococcaceae bacterium 1109]|nr:MAG: hypothetical protein AA931_01240 [Peptococcaceae bacterium 1109]
MTIWLQPEDELNTIIHRIQATSDAEVTLVVPGEGGVLRDPVAWGTVAQYAERFGKQVMVDTEDPVVRELVLKAGLSVAGEELAAAAGEKEDHDKASRTRTMVERLSVVLLIAAACLALIYFALPKVTLIVTPAVAPFQHVLNFPLAGLEAAQALEVELTLVRRTPATGQKVLGTAHAVGEVVLINQKAESVLVPRGTVVSTASETPFQITTDVEVPGVETQYFMGIPVGIQAGQAVAPIKAVAPGSAGNVAEGRVVYIAGFDLDVRNPEPTRGGADTVLQVSSEDDLARARHMVERDAEQAILSKLSEELTGSPYKLLSGTLEIELEWEGHTPLGEETEDVFAAAKVRGRGYALDEEQLAREVEQGLAAVLPPDHILLPHTLQLGDVELGMASTGPFLQLTVEGTSRAVVRAEEVADRIAGSAVADLGSIAEDMPAVGALHVVDYAGEYLPRLKRWLSIEVQEPVL